MHQIEREEVIEGIVRLPASINIVPIMDFYVRPLENPPALLIVGHHIAVVETVGELAQAGHSPQVYAGKVVVDAGVGDNPQGKGNFVVRVACHCIAEIPRPCCTLKNTAGDNAHL